MLFPADDADNMFGSKVCVARTEYYGLVGALFLLLFVVVVVTGVAGVCYRRATAGKMSSGDLGQPSIASVIASGVTFGPKRGDLLEQSRRRMAYQQEDRYRENGGGGRGAASHHTRFSFHQPDLNPPPL